MLSKWLLGRWNEKEEPGGSDGVGFSDKEARVRQIPVDEITSNSFQPRVAFAESDLRELADSIGEVGVIAPVVVRPSDAGDAGYELVVGERRWRASRMAGLERIPALVRTLDDRQVAVIALTENLQREDLHYLEEACGYRRVIRQFGLTQSQLAEELGLSQPTVSNKLRLLTLPEDLQKQIRSLQVSERHARALLRLPDEEAQQKVLDCIVRENLSVRETVDLVDDLLNEEVKSEPRVQKVEGIIRDIRIYLNGLEQTVESMRESGLKADIDRIDLGDRYRIIIEVKKGTAGGEDPRDA